MYGPAQRLRVDATSVSIRGALGHELPDGVGTWPASSPATTIHALAGRKTALNKCDERAPDIVLSDREHEETKSQLDRQSRQSSHQTNNAVRQYRPNPESWVAGRRPDGLTRGLLQNRENASHLRQCFIGIEPTAAITCALKSCMKSATCEHESTTMTRFPATPTATPNTGRRRAHAISNCVRTMSADRANDPRATTGRARHEPPDRAAVRYQDCSPTRRVQVRTIRGVPPSIAACRILA